MTEPATPTPTPAPVKKPGLLARAAALAGWVKANQANLHRLVTLALVLYASLHRAGV